MENKMIEIKEEIIIGDVILEKGDKIEVLKEGSHRNSFAIQQLADETFRGSFEMACTAIAQDLDEKILANIIRRLKISYGF